jgi:hypothetical protein
MNFFLPFARQTIPKTNLSWGRARRLNQRQFGVGRLNVATNA